MPRVRLRLSGFKVNSEVMEHPLVEVAIAYAAFLSVLIALVELLYPLSYEARVRLYVVDLAIVSILIVDYVYRARSSGDPLGYVKKTFYEIPALIPVGLLAFLESQLAGLGLLRLLRLLRLIRVAVLLARGSRLLRLAGETARSLRVVYIIGFTLITLFFGSLAIYVVEGSHPQGQIKDLPTAFWWAIVTATTVGYGDIVPATGLGRAVGVLMMLLGIASLSLTVGIIASFFTRALEARAEAPEARVEELCLELRRLGDMSREELDSLLARIELEWRAARSRS